MAEGARLRRAIAMAGGFEAWRGLGLPVDVDGVVDDEDDDDGDPATWNCHCVVILRSSSAH